MTNMYSVTKLVLTSVVIGFSSYLYSRTPAFNVYLSTVWTQIQSLVPVESGGRDKVNESEKVYTREELSLYNGQNGQLYLAILGKVFDVSKAPNFYQPGGTYHMFTGRDASKAFVTGDFTGDGLTDDVSELQPSDLAQLQTWVLFYEKEYELKGKVEGRFYDRNGQPTNQLNVILSKIEAAEHERKSVEGMEQKYPPCNVEWDRERGSRVWCSKQSGGIKRNWVGVPRQFYQVGLSKPRCACVNLGSESKGDGRFKEFQGCSPESTSCYVKT